MELDDLTLPATHEQKSDGYACGTTVRWKLTSFDEEARQGLGILQLTPHFLWGLLHTTGLQDPRGIAGRGAKHRAGGAASREQVTACETRCMMDDSWY